MSLRDLGQRLTGEVVLPGDATWDADRQVWNLAVDQRPMGIVWPRSAQDVVATVRFAAERGLRIAFNAGGHNAGTIAWADDVLLLKTGRMDAITIDPAERRARVEAGVLARPLAQAAGAHGLAYLAGTSPDVGVLGYMLGGGLSWLIRRHGLACESITAADVVTSDGRQVRVDRDTEPDLFWAIRGGGGNVGAVTAVELELFAIPRVYAGCLFWPIDQATRILGAWRGWIEDVPLECESLGRMLQLPDLPFLPDHLRGRAFVLVELAFIGDEVAGAELVRPLRELDPEFDTVSTMPTSDLSVVNMDPEVPVPYAGEGMLLDAFTPETIDALVDVFVGSSLLHVEVRQLGGAAAVSSPDHGVLDAIEQPYVLFTFGLTPDPAIHAAVEGHVRSLVERMTPWDSGRRYLNFAESPIDPRSIYGPGHDRLKDVRARYDPTGLFLPNHPA
jgi:FAD/FMN-containing dehydrogenase